jgi:hypothetical protein
VGCETQAGPMGPAQATGLPYILAISGSKIKEEMLAAAQEAHGFG